MTTYRDLYDQMINEVYNHHIDGLPHWITGGFSASRLMRENDPVDYRCGFVDWLDGEEFKCACGRTFRNVNVDKDDDVECYVCSGDEFECESCGELFDCDEMSRINDMCSECYDKFLLESERINKVYDDTMEKSKLGYRHYDRRM